MEKELIRIRRALLTVSDKTGLAELARGLREHGAELISPGKTPEPLRNAGLTVTGVAEVTGLPEMLDGRVKTLHPAIHGAILARRSDPEHERQLTEHRISPIDLVAVNLYPFETTIADKPHPSPPFLVLELERIDLLRYGENPHQQGALYREHRSTGLSLASARQLQGKALSYTNLLDLDAALRLVLDFPPPAACIVKHNNPCGAAIGELVVDAYGRAYRTDPLSAYGGVVGLNRPVDEAAATEIASTFVEAVIAPDYTEAAREILRPRKNLRLMQIPAKEWQIPPDPWDMRRISGGLLLQERDRADPDQDALRRVTRREPTPAEWEALAFASKVVKHVKSNAIVFSTATATVGIGAGQMSRVDACRLAVMKAQSS